MQAELQRLAALVGPGQSLRAVCPVCAASHEESFLVRRDAHNKHVVWWRCYRAKCGVAGRHHDIKGLTMSVLNFDEDHKPLKDWHSVPLAVLKDLSNQLGISTGALYAQGVQYDPIEDIIVYPWVNCVNGRDLTVGYQTRAIGHKDIRTHRENDRAYQYSKPHFKGGGLGECIVVVENLWSAYKLADMGYRSVALLGHVLSPSVAIHFVNEGVKTVLFLLDPDTWPNGVVKALRVAEAAGLTAKAAYLSEKPHRMAQQSLKEAISNIQL